MPSQVHNVLVEKIIPRRLSARHARSPSLRRSRRTPSSARPASTSTTICGRMSSHGGVMPMITLKECAEFVVLEKAELFTGAALSTRHRSLLSSYLFNLKRGHVAVRKMIVSDIRAAIDLGASKYAADLLLVLRIFLSKHPEARIVRQTSLRYQRTGLRALNREGRLDSVYQKGGSPS